MEVKTGRRRLDLHDEIEKFSDFGTRTIVEESSIDAGRAVPCYVNEFWTAQQRSAHSLHEISYRACFKPQLPRFFIERLTRPGDTVYDPFMGRGTTLLEAVLLGRKPGGCDANPLSEYLIRSRLSPPTLQEVERRLEAIPLGKKVEVPEDLHVFYHAETLKEIANLRHYFLERENRGEIDLADDWIRMVAINRMTGHSPGFFSVYTLPPNQATSIKSQMRINQRRKQTPPWRDVKTIILKKSRSLLKDCQDAIQGELFSMEDMPEIRTRDAIILTGSADNTPEIPDESIYLVVTSPPFLDVVDYAQDNWLRGWFCGFDTKELELAVFHSIETWNDFMLRVFRELNRVLVPGGYVAFEVGEVRKGTVRLEEAVLKVGIQAGLKPELVLINAQEFTKTANCWGVANGSKGTNTNRIALFRKD